MASSGFLADVNNEVLSTATRNETYANNLASLENFILVLFTEDETVIPKESAWFGSETLSEESERRPSRLLSNSLRGQYLLASERVIVPMREQPLYLEDYIGLRSLDERDGVVLVTCAGKHMHLTGCWEDLAEKWLGRQFPE